MTTRSTFYIRKGTRYDFVEVVLCDTKDEFFEKLNADWWDLDCVIYNITVNGYECEVSKDTLGYFLEIASGECRGEYVYRLTKNEGEKENDGEQETYS